MDSLQELVDVTSVDSNVVRESVVLQSKDFEDALQFNSAKMAYRDIKNSLDSVEEKGECKKL